MRADTPFGMPRIVLLWGEALSISGEAVALAEREYNLRGAALAPPPHVSQARAR